MTQSERFILWALPKVARSTLFAQQVTGLTSPQLALVMWALCAFLPGVTLAGQGGPIGALFILGFWVVILRWAPDTVVEARCWRARWDPEGIPTTQGWVSICATVASLHLRLLPFNILGSLVGARLLSSPWVVTLWVLGGVLLGFLVALVASVPTLPPEERVLNLTPPLPGEA